MNLSESVYGSTSVAAIGVAAHECGHAIQHQQGYVPLTLRSAIVPVANLGSTLAWPLILIGLFFTSNTGTFLIDLGILCFSFAVLFQLDASGGVQCIAPRAAHFRRAGNLKRQ